MNVIRRKLNYGLTSTNFDVNILRDHLKPLLSLETQTPRCGEVLQEFTSLAIMNWHNTSFVGDIAWISLYSLHQRLEILGKTLVKTGLCPIYAEVPVARTLIEARILFEDSACNTSLVTLAVI